MKEAYSEQILHEVLVDTGAIRKGTMLVVDPYAGSGTTGVSLADQVFNGNLRGARFAGIEANPFLRLAASAKVRALESPPAGFRRIGGHVAAKALRPRAPRAAMPGLSTFHRPEFFSPEAIHELLCLRAAVDAVSGDVPDLIADLLRVCLAAAVEPSSNLRRDGRALRYEPAKGVRRPIDEFLLRVQCVADDLEAVGDGFAGDVVEADARCVGAFEGVARADLAIFSPPYPNNIDYTEVYKLEAWLLGLICTSDQFADQRRRSVRSHPSLKFDEVYSYSRTPIAHAVEALAEPLLAAVPRDDRYAAGRRRVIRGYLDDMLQTLQHLKSCLRPGAPLVYVVGNSMHGSPGNDQSYVIAADLLIARLAELVGFQIDRILVARRPKRRANDEPFLRESVVFAISPEQPPVGER